RNDEADLLPPHADWRRYWRWLYRSCLSGASDKRECPWFQAEVSIRLQFFVIFPHRKGNPRAVEQIRHTRYVDHPCEVSNVKQVLIRMDCEVYELHSTFEESAIRNDFVEAPLPHRVLPSSNVESATVRVRHPDRQRELELCPLRVRTQGREAATVRLDARPT